MTRLIIFDCDGVLVDSEPIAVRIDVEMLAEVGVTMSEAEVIERYVGRSPQVIVAETEATIGGPVPDGWFERGEARIREAYATELRPVAGVADALHAIEDPICVASSSGHDSRSAICSGGVGRAGVDSSSGVARSMNPPQQSTAASSRSLAHANSSV